MRTSKTYTLPFSGLKLGKHEFDFYIDQSFFDQYEYSLVKKGKLQVRLEMEKQETMLVLQFHIKGTVDLNCDRCLAEFPSKMEVSERQLIQFTGEKNESNDDEIVMLSKNEFEIDVAPFIYEFINVHIPFHKVCDELSEQQCDKEMIKYLQVDTKAPLKEEKQNDPRWEALNKLKK